MLRNLWVSVAIVVGSGCSRPETPEYFKKVTELPLCDSAIVTNLNDHDPANSPGFDSIYVVEVSDTADCQESLLRSVERRTGERCDGETCSGIDRKGNFIRVDKQKSGVKITFST